MKGLCPECFGKDPECENCDGIGELEFSFKSGYLWTQECPDCGFENGGHITDNDIEPDDGYMQEKCVMCGAKNVRWKLLGTV